MEIAIALLIAVIVVLVTSIAFLSVRYRAPDHSKYDTPQGTTMIADSEVSPAHQQVVEKLAAFNKQAATDTKVARIQMEELFYRDIDAEIIPVDVAGIPGEWVLAPGASPARRLLYLHGGAFRVGSPRSHRHITGELSRLAGVAVLAIDYRMQPEFKTIHCHEDARTAYQWILEHGPSGDSAPESLFVAGDSAGGNLTLSLIAWARDQKLRAVDGAIAFAPATDATFSSPTWKSNAATDPFLGPAIGPMLRIPAFLLALLSRPSVGRPPNDPEISPLLGNLANLPKTLIQVSRDEMLYGDAQRYANKAQLQGSDVSLQVWPKMVHVFQGFPELPESSAALQLVADFVKLQIGRNEPARNLPPAGSI